MNGRCQVSEFQTITNGNGNLGDGFSCSFANDACSKNHSVAVRNYLDQTAPIIFVDSAVHFADVERANEQIFILEGVTSFSLSQADLRNLRSSESDVGHCCRCAHIISWN